MKHGLDIEIDAVSEALASASARQTQLFGAQPGRRVERVEGEAPVAGPAPYLSIQHAGFSLNAAVYIPADDPEALERLCRYILRPAIAQKRLQLLEGDRVALTLRHPWRDGTKQLCPTSITFPHRRQLNFTIG
jgi:hypothetical protein